MKRIPLGPVDDIADDECVAIDEGRAVVVRVGDRVCAYRNRCLHQDSPLAGGWVRDGVLSCPLHFWRYRVESGQHLGGGEALESFDVEVRDGEAFVLLPDEPPPRSLRDELLERARGYDRETEFRRETGGVGTPPGHGDATG